MPPIPIIAFAIFGLAVAFTGGSSRPDNIWLLGLRPIAVLCIVAMLLTARPDWRSIRPLPLLLALFATTIAIQLVPLPSAIWQSLPGRETYTRVAQALGGAGQWHPLALSPDRTWNSLIALMVPFGIMLGFLLLNERQRRLLLLPVLGTIAFSMLLGVAQIASGGSSMLYWYKISGHDQLIGLLANRNHQGAMLAMALPLIRAWTLFPTRSPQESRHRLLMGLAAAAVILLYILVLGSRAGLVLAVVGLVAALLVAPTLGATRLSVRARWLAAGGFAVGIAAIVVLVLSMDRAVAIGRLVDDDLSTEGRLAALPTLLRIVGDTFPFGTGFGSFVPVYASYEPDALLKTTYFNNAHNDLIELVITGGLPALAVFLAFFVWWLWTSWRRFTSPARSQSWRALHRAASFAILVLLLASIADYPLRTPLLGAVFTLLCCWLAYTPANGTSDSHD
ncbi:O-antigen ligase family protein [Sphingomonas hengshuiensis]|uniref:O-antigen ligase-related domain-containing protein n=1 Tax=Sphingomonas hengshuiensis TaxID=1609977 RepID=A0A7U5CVD0_9SPHN|nr:O-antigen ligase family protein [Sphingomonas hengshuiensis]AJP74794.1 hypothetical protein TS85_23745 [Sphingomonas hengshuiensis]